MSSVVLLSTLALLGCRELECTSEEAYGVQLDISEEGDVHDEPIEVRYRVDGGEWRSDAQCPERTLCLLGLELDGTYEIEVTRGGTTVTVETQVRADRCHVLTQTVPITIPSA
jgi:hypothetical protein